MADIFSTKKRGEIMSRIKCSGTAVENTLHSIVRESIGMRWRVDRNSRILPGKPDIVIPTLRLVIFADGCFYHVCPEHGHAPKSNKKYWLPKLAQTRQRDKRNRRELRRMGFTVWRFWEHSLRGRLLHKTRFTIMGKLRRLILERRLPTRSKHRRSVPDSIIQ